MHAMNSSPDLDPGYRFPPTVSSEYFICGCYLVAKSRLTVVNPWTVACQSPLSMGFSRQEY